MLWHKRSATANLKKNVRPLKNSLGYIEKLQPFAFEYDKEKLGNLKLPSGLQYGFIAEDVRQVLPDIVNNENKFLPAGKNNFTVATISNTDLQSLIPIWLRLLKNSSKK